MIYYNPSAGSSSKKHLDRVIDFLQLTNYSFDILQTNHRWHCVEHLNALAYQEYEGVVIISGDGLMH
jgi:diacylglycerol kinase family enzyme